MSAIWQNLPTHAQRLFIALAILTAIVLIGMQFQVNTQGSKAETYPKGFRGGTCTIESDTLLVGYSAYFIPSDYAIPEDAMSAMSIPILCGKVPSPGLLNITIDLLYPVTMREQPIAISLAQKHGEKIMEPFLSIPAASYPSGSISQEVHIQEPGEYVLRLSGIDEHQAAFHLDMPITVGTNWIDTILPYWPMALLCVLAAFFYNFRRIVD